MCGQTLLDFYRRRALPPIDLLQCLPRGLEVGQTLELMGEPGTGKTALLMECLVRCLLPKRCGTVPINGHERCAAVVDTGGGFHMITLAEQLRLHLVRAGIGAGAVDLEVRACLERLLVVRCGTPRELVLGLCALRFHIDSVPDVVPDDTPTVPAPTGATFSEVPRLLLIDSLTAFQWSERTHREGGATRHETELSKALGHLRPRLSIVWTRNPLVSQEDGYEFPAVKPHVLAGLNPTLRLRLRMHHVEAPGHAGHGGAAQPVHLQTLLDDADSGSGSGATTMTRQPKERRDVKLMALGVMAVTRVS